MLISDNANRLYFTGFHSSAGNVLITRNNAYFLIDFRYYEKAAKTVKGCNVILCTRLFEQLSVLLSKEDIKKVYLETESVTIASYKALTERLTGVEISTSAQIQKIILDLRSVKSSEEIKLIKRAQKLTDDAFEFILSKIKVGAAEREIALQLEFFMRERGSEGASFDFIVVSGKNSSLPHGVPTDKKIQNGDLVTMDFGGVISGYRSDMTRTVAVGDITEKQAEVYATVLRAQKAALENIKAGAVCRDIDKIARDIIQNAGYGECFGHGLGHSVGIEIHEGPAFNTRDTTVLRTGTVITVEPGIYIENEFGVRIEDMVAVTESGCENLTHSPKELIIL